MTQEIRDNAFRLLGSISEEGEKRVGYTLQGSRVGEYDKSSNTTRDLYGRIIGYGDQLIALVREAGTS